MNKIIFLFISVFLVACGEEEYQAVQAETEGVEAEAEKQTVIGTWEFLSSYCPVPSGDPEDFTIEYLSAEAFAGYMGDDLLVITEESISFKTRTYVSDNRVENPDYSLERLEVNSLMTKGTGYINVLDLNETFRVEFNKVGMNLIFPSGCRALFNQPEE